MKLRHVLISAVSGLMFAAPVLTEAAQAGDPSRAAMYRGGGYTIRLQQGKYKGCDSKERCVNIPRFSSRNKDQTIWKHQGDTYTLSEIRNSPIKPKYEANTRLTVTNAKGTVVLNVAMSFVDYLAGSK
jgi:hypothetical protein